MGTPSGHGQARICANDIFVLDMKNTNEWKLRKSKIPFNVIPRFAVRTGGIDSNDENLVIGYIRDCFKQKEFENIQLPPSYLMKMISEKYNAETIHCIDKRERWCIYLKDILNSLHF